MNEKQLTQVYETLLSVPGMNDTVKVDLRLPRRTILYLVQVLEKGLETGINVPSFGPDGSDLEQVIADCLAKAGLTDLHTSLRRLAAD